MKINYFSDIHLEFGSIEIPQNDADLIIAAGDIGVYKQGVEWLKNIDKPVIYIAGNHEFYSHEYNKTVAELRKECNGSNITYLENDEIIFQGIRFLGCTLWADLFIDGESTAEALGKTLNDFRKVDYQDGKFNPASFTKLHHNSKNWLMNALKRPFEGKTVIVTHHAPSEWSWNDSPHALKKFAYCNDLKELLHEFEISAWYHGHVHSLGDYRIAGARILCNPRGYYGRKLVDGFDINKTVEI